MTEFRDDDGRKIKVGHHLVSAYGIPPVRIVGKVTEHKGVLMVSTPGHNPKVSTLEEFIEALGNVWITKETK